jgi:ABC-type multidrug transport system fused ATPase/permease subunit
VLFFLLRPLARAVHRMAESNAELNASYMTMLNEAATIVSDTRTYGVVDAEEERLTASLERIRHPWQRVQRLHGLVPGAYQTAALTLLLVAVGIIAVAGLNASIGNLGAVVLVFLRALASSQQLQYSYQRLRESEPFADRAFALIDRLEERHPKQGTVPVARVERLSLEQVSFSYKLNRPALDHVTLDIRRGECVGVTGPSGAGKSTLAAVVLGLLTPDVGRYLVNGVPVDDIAPGDWSRLLGYVPQEGRLLTGTVSENIRFLRDGISSDDVEWAARAAHLHDDVVRWTDGYDTIVSQRTEAVSGGQRQRICLARALVCRPDLLVLDEPTSALDAEAEDVVFESLAALRGTVTMVVISHRPRLLGLCERVMHLRHGHTAEEDPAPGSPAAAAS